MPPWLLRSSCNFPRKRRRRPSSRASPWKSCPSRNHRHRSQSLRRRKRRRHRGRRPLPPSRSLHLLRHHLARHQLQPSRRRPPRHRSPSKRLQRRSRMRHRTPSICRHRMVRRNKLIRYRPSRSGRHRGALRKPRRNRIRHLPPRPKRLSRNRRRVRPHHQRQRQRPNRRRRRQPYRRSSWARPRRAKERGRPFPRHYRSPPPNHLLPSKSSSLCAKHLSVRMVRAQRKRQPLRRPRARTTPR
ncbi:hypothetical protein C8J33_101351 [Rhizobium sp. PP-CC-3G-465]|nr:hypothetical protein C8J33_101351 [Rhizobium sp. PP-CC-3G-465]